MNIDASEIKQDHRRRWSTGDYPDLAKHLESAAELVVKRVGAGPGMELLDVATGTGNVAICAARCRARVTGLDLTPELLQTARRRATGAGVEIRWVEGDAEELPFGDASFDCVTSCFGVVFAPRHNLAASELARVARPGATIALTAWTPEGLIGQMAATFATYLPPPPPGFTSSALWGTEDHVRSLFARSGAELSFERLSVIFGSDSPESWAQYITRALGPAVEGRATVERQGRWARLQEAITLCSEGNEADDGGFRAAAEYLLTLARLPA